MMLLENTHIMKSPILEKTGDGVLRMSGVLMQADQKNKNGRIYPRKVLEEVVNKFNGAGKFVIGELTHPDSLEINLERASHVIESMEMRDDSSVFGTIRILDTPCGNIVRGIVESGADIGISSRAGGEVVKEGDADVVRNMEFLTCDIVHNPSVGHAIPTAIKESVEHAEDTFKKSILKEENQKKLIGLILNSLTESLDDLQVGHAMSVSIVDVLPRDMKTIDLKAMDADFKRLGDALSKSDKILDANISSTEIQVTSDILSPDELKRFVDNKIDELILNESLVVEKLYNLKESVDKNIKRMMDDELTYARQGTFSPSYLISNREDSLKSYFDKNKDVERKHNSKLRKVYNLKESVTLNERGIWSDEQETEVDELDKEFAKLLKSKGVKPTSKEASDLWKSKGFKTRMHKITNKYRKDK